MWKIIIIFFICMHSSSLTARLMDGEELLLNILYQQNKIIQFYFEANVKVYQIQLSEIIQDVQYRKHIPQEKKEHSFQQNVTWIRDEFLGIKIKDQNEDKLLHFFIEAEGREFSKSFDENRHFSDEDTLIHFPSFYTKHLYKIKKVLYELGVYNREVSIEIKKDQVFYRLGHKGNYLLINPELYRIEEITRKIQLDGKFYPYQILFSNWHPRYPHLPRKIEFFINHHLIKEISIDKISFRGVGSYRRNIVREYKQILSSTKEK